MSYFIPLFEGECYHIYNRGNNRERIFFQKKNYAFFMKLFDRYLGNYVVPLAHCLLPNHFHFMIRIKSFKDLPMELSVVRKGEKILFKPQEVLSEQFRKFFMAYAKAIKIQENRTGSLFEKNFKRIWIRKSGYYTKLINYIHRNPQAHRITDDFTSYPYSSYQAFASEESWEQTDHEVKKWFGSHQLFVEYHQTNPLLKELIALE